MTDSDELHLNDSDCERFAELVEQVWADERPLSEAAKAFYSSHKNACEECSKYDELLSVLNDLPESDEAQTTDKIREILDQKFASTGRHFYRTVGLAAALLIGLAFVLMLAFLSRGEKEKPKDFSLAHGGLILEGRSIDVGEQFSFEEKAAQIPMDTLIEIPNKLFIAMAENSKISHVDQVGKKIRILVEHGRIAVHLVPGSQLNVEVETQTGIVEVKGTVFIVEADRKADEVSVVRGRVQVRSKKHKKESARFLDAGQAFSFNDQKQSPRRVIQADHLLALLGISETLKETAIETPSVITEDTDAGDSELGLEKSADVQTERPAPETLLKAARECRAAGNWKCAVDHYGKVVALYPGIPDAATAMIPIAEILLENLSRPKEALQYFRRYQKKRPQGGLGQEALYGECRALEQMGRAKAERACLSRYLEKYPNTLYTQMAKSRLMGIMVKD